MLDTIVESLTIIARMKRRHSWGNFWAIFMAEALMTPIHPTLISMIFQSWDCSLMVF